MPYAASMNDIAADAARAALTARSFRRVLTERTTDLDGGDAIRVMLIVNDLRQAPISGDAAGNAILNVKQRLQAAGEQRSIFVEFATEDELSADGDA